MIKIPTSAEFVVSSAEHTEIRCCGEYWQGWKLDTSYAGSDVSIRVLDESETAKYNAIMHKHKASKNWREFYNLMQFWHDVRDIHALTVHKSQGSTFQNVFLDLRDLRKCRLASERNALLYVALTRAAQRLFVLGE